MRPIPMFFKAVTPGKTKEKPDEGQPGGGQRPDSDIVEHEPELGPFAELLALLSERGAGGGDFGPDNVERGHQVAFAAGAFSGSGQVSAVGRDGVHVMDETHREHRVHWREITGHQTGGAQQDKEKGKDAL